MVNESVQRESAIERLPDAYAVALRMRDAGLSYAAIAERVGVEPEAVGPMLRVAEAKLASTGYDDTSES